MNMAPLPTPPMLKTTIIQLNKDVDPEDNNFEVLSNEYMSEFSAPPAVSHVPSEEQPKRKRRRLSSFVDQEEMAKRRLETKQLHSLIEKRRRIKINREFEALKYLIPACRTADSGPKKSLANNANKIDGMYKLTILKTSVEYILYLHHILQKQHEMLSRLQPGYNFDISFSEIPLDVNQYRNIDHDFDFLELLTQHASRASIQPIPEHKEAEAVEEPAKRPRPFSKSDPLPFSNTEQLPTPDVTPEISPILSMLSKYKNGGRVEPKTIERMQPREIEFLNKTFSFNASGTKQPGNVSTSTSPFTIPIRSKVKNGSFSLPDPALGESHPKKMMFRSEVPVQNSVSNVGVTEQDVVHDIQEADKLADALKTLLAFRKPSIGKMLN